MKKNKSGEYLTPSIETIEMSSKDVLCESGYVDDYDVINPWDGVSSAPADEF